MHRMSKSTKGSGRSEHVEARVVMLRNAPEKAQVGQEGKSGADRDAWLCS